MGAATLAHSTARHCAPVSSYMFLSYINLILHRLIWSCLTGGRAAGVAVIVGVPDDKSGAAGRPMSMP